MLRNVVGSALLSAIFVWIFHSIPTRGLPAVLEGLIAACVCARAYPWSPVRGILLKNLTGVGGMFAGFACVFYDGMVDPASAGGLFACFCLVVCFSGVFPWGGHRP